MGAILIVIGAAAPYIRRMLKVAILTFILAGLVTDSLAKDLTPLSPGKPAGVRRAQEAVPSSAVFLGALAAVAIAGVVLIKSSNNFPTSTSAPTGTNP
jgi:hypothetical protein